MKQSQPHSSHPKYRPDIDGLRAIAVLSVVAFHAFPDWIQGGFIGVDIFFVISGFLISTIIFESLDKGVFKFSDFYIRRIKRIFPALLLVLFVSFIFGWFILLADEYKQLGKHITGAAGFVSNFVFWGEVGYFDNAADTKPLLHLWSLGIEEQFYIIWPLMLWFVWKSRFNRLIVLILLALFSFAGNVVVVQSDSVAAFYSPLTRFWELLFGSILAWCALYKADSWFGRRVAHNNKQIVSNIFSIGGILLFVCGFWFIDKDSHFPGIWALLPVLGTVLVISAGPQAWTNRTILSNKIVVWFGLISYPLYLWHWPMLSFAYIIERGALSVYMSSSLVLISIFLAWLTYKFIERPIRFGQYSKIIITVLVVLMTLTGFIGYFTYARDGLLFRSIADSAMQQREAIRKSVSSQRSLGVKRGICHFNQSKSKLEIESFIENWNCFSDNEDLVDSRVLVFGDSHSADLAMALRLNGIDVVQISGSGCPLNLSLINTKTAYCTQLFNLVDTHSNVFDSIFLSNRFPKEQLTKENLGEILQYWTGNKTVYLFSPLPDFTVQMNEYLKFGTISSKPDFSSEDVFFELLEKLKVPKNIKIIRTSDLWCDDRTSSSSHPCYFEKNGNLLMVDGGHLGVEGAKIIGKYMLEDPILSRVLNNIKP